MPGVLPTLRRRRLAPVPSDLRSKATNFISISIPGSTATSAIPFTKSPFGDTRGAACAAPGEDCAEHRAAQSPLSSGSGFAGPADTDQSLAKVAQRLLQVIK